MKKLFLAALALTLITGCSNENERRVKDCAVHSSIATDILAMKDKGVPEEQIVSILQLPTRIQSKYSSSTTGMDEATMVTTTEALTYYVYHGNYEPKALTDRINAICLGSDMRNLISFNLDDKIKEAYAVGNK